MGRLPIYSFLVLKEQYSIFSTASSLVQFAISSYQQHIILDTFPSNISFLFSLIKNNIGPSDGLLQYCISSSQKPYLCQKHFLLVSFLSDMKSFFFLIHKIILNQANSLVQYHISASQKTLYNGPLAVQYTGVLYWQEQIWTVSGLTTQKRIILNDLRPFYQIESLFF